MNTYTDPAIRLTMMPRDTNPHGTIFGGIILSHIDSAGAIVAARHTGHDRFVTVTMREVIFHEPVFIGDLVSLYGEVIRIGNTSVTVRVAVEAERHRGTAERVRVTEAEVVYVAVDENRRKMKLTRRQLREAEQTLRDKEASEPVAVEAGGEKQDEPAGASR